ncbi:MAG: hypothetical protein GC154_07390 [bacterium]|nr:hypothetical protein [bacterium]
MRFRTKNKQPTVGQHGDFITARRVSRVVDVAGSELFMPILGGEKQGVARLREQRRPDECDPANHCSDKHDIRLPAGRVNAPSIR